MQIRLDQTARCIVLNFEVLKYNWANSVGKMRRLGATSQDISIDIKKAAPNIIQYIRYGTVRYGTVCTKCTGRTVCAVCVGRTIEYVQIVRYVRM